MKYETGAGDVPITLDGKQMYLRPSLAAAMELSRAGIPQLVKLCNDCNWDALMKVVQLGTGESPQALKKPIYDAGLFYVAAQCIEYLHVLANGGRPVIDGEAGNPTQGEQKG